VSLEQQAPAV